MINTYNSNKKYKNSYFFKALLAQIKDRPMHGSNEARIYATKQGLWAMEHTPQVAYKCGPYAVGTLYLLNHKTLAPKIKSFHSTSNGTSFKQVKDLAQSLGLNYILAKRESNDVPIITPCIMHWAIKDKTVGHFAAITKEFNNKGQIRYVIKDPTFDAGSTIAMSQRALNSESDGYFLIPENKSKSLPKGWVKVTDSEAEKIWGKGNAGSANPQKTPQTPGQCMSANCPPSPQAPPPIPSSPQTPPQCKGGNCPPPNCNGMPYAQAWSAQAQLNIIDTPLTYSPVIGAEMDFRINYSQNEGNQPSTYTYSNLTPNWSLNWISRLTHDGNNNVTISVRGGGYETYQNNGTVANPVYEHELLSQALVVYIDSGVYQRQLPDGSIEVFNLSDSAGNIYLTQVIDPAGNVTTINYNTSTFRINNVTDANGHSVNFGYVSNTSGNSGYYLIASLTDDFKQSAQFGYDSTNSYLVSITDAAGNISQLGYGIGTSQINRLTSPYGTTLYTVYQPQGSSSGLATGLRFTFPDGTSSTIENWLGETKETYFWDRQALALYPSDPAGQIYNHCKTTRWLWQQQTGQEIPIPNWVKDPLEAKTTYFYDNESIQDIYSGTINKPIEMIKAISGAWMTNISITGTATVGDIVNIQVNDQAFPYGYEQVHYTIATGDTLNTIASGLANAINNDTQCQLNGVTAKSAGATVNISSTSPNQPAFNFWSSAGRQNANIVNNTSLPETCSLTGTITASDTLSITVTDSGLPNGSETVTVTAVANDTLGKLALRLANAINSDTNLQALPVTAQVSGDNINILSFSNNPTTYTQATSSGATEKISLTQATSSITLQSAQYQWNEWGNLIQSVDPIGRTVNNVYAQNGIDKIQVIAGGNANDNNSTGFIIGSATYNNQHEPLIAKNASAQTTTYTYNVFGEPISVTDALGNTSMAIYTGTAIATIGGTITISDILTITVQDAGLAGGQLPITYTVQSSDTLNSIAIAIASLINANSSLQAIGVSAQANNAIITIKSTSPNGTSYSESTSSGATETITLSAIDNGYLTAAYGPLPGNNDVTLFSINPTGTLASTTNSQSYSLSFIYDNLNRLLSTTYPDGTQSTNTYKNLDTIFATDRIGRSTQYDYNSLDQLIATTDNLGRKTQYKWCNCGSLASMTDANGNVTKWHHDIEGRLLTKTYCDGTTENYTYEANNGRLSALTDAKSQVTVMAYNLDSTLNTKAYSNSEIATSNVSYTYDPNFNRLTSVSNNWGANAFTYNQYPVNPNVPILGGGTLAGIYNNVIKNSNINFDYDAIGRNIRTCVNTLDSQILNNYDVISRLTSQTNQLGTFNYNYMNDTAGKSYGDTRLASILSPNNQVTALSYYGNVGDERLEQITSINNNGNVLNQQNYGYDPSGQITKWMQQSQNTSPVLFDNTYDKVGQLIGFSGNYNNNQIIPSLASGQYYSYDNVSNRTSIEKIAIEPIAIEGTITAGDVLTITIFNKALSGGQEAISYTVAGSDTLNAIAAKLAGSLTTDINLNAIGFNAYSNNNNLYIRDLSSNPTTYSQSVNSGATEVIKLGFASNVIENVTINGSVTANDVLTLNILDSGISGGRQSVSYTVVSGDTLNSIASNMAAAINNDANLQAINIIASAYSNTISVNSKSTNVTTYTSSINSGATETINLSTNLNNALSAAIIGTVSANDTITLNVNDIGLSGNTQAVTYAVSSTDTLNSIATNLVTAINNNTNLQAIGVTALANNAIITLNSNSINLTSYLFSRNINSTESIVTGINNNQMQTLLIGGNVTANDALSVNVYNTGLTNGYKTITYTTVSGDTLNSIASNMAIVINSDANLQAIGVTATSINGVININSKSINSTTYSSSTNSSATETLSLGLTTRLDQSIYNNLNQLVNLNSGGSLRFSGNTSKAMKSVNFATPVVSISANPNNSILAQTTYAATATTSSGITSPTMWVDIPQASNGMTIATINGNSVTAGSIISITVYNANLANGQEIVRYTATSSDTFTTIATALTNQLNADTKLQAIGLGASASNSKINLSISQPTYSTSLSTGATETATFGYNNLGNIQLTIGGKVTSGDVITIIVTDAYLTGGQASVSYTVQANDTLTSIATGIANAINASSSLSAINITGTNNANVAFTGQNFNTSLPIANGSTSVTITGIDGGNNQATSNTQISTTGQNNANTSFDLNGNMINDGTNTYQYDAEDRLVQITYPGTGNNTQIFYDGLGHWVKSIETTNNATTSVIQYLWNGNRLIEERDGSSNVLRRFFGLGEQINGTNYYYVKDHLGSIRQMTDSSGNLVYQADYDAYGQATVSINTITPAFGYAGYYAHNRSGLNLTVYRAYNPTLARWLNRDPIGEAGGVNLYAYVGNDPVSQIDRSGLITGSPFIHNNTIENCFEDCFNEYLDCKSSCFANYPCPSPSIDDCLSNCKATLFRCQADCHKVFN